MGEFAVVEQVTPIGTFSAMPNTREQIPALAAGLVVDARVLALMETGIVRLAIGGRIFDAATTAQLVPGSTVRLLVEEQGGSLKLSVVERGQTPPAMQQADAARPLSP
ncbi:MAG: hypothetical protein HC829_07785, partial [Bacteroidales bacterium]|nr:hypothetical protein [Bacteroidales bacterium]